VLFSLVVGVSVLCWGLVNSSPRVLSMILPSGLTFALGAVLFVLGLFAAFVAAYALRQPAAVIGSFVQSYVGLWLVFAASAGLRGSAGYDEVTRRVGLMMALLVGVIVAVLYVPDARVVSLMNVGLLGAGWYLTADRRHSRGR